MTQDSNSSFIVRFVAADRGVKSEARVQGRIAFPSNRGPQPKAGEFWRVTIQGENPKKTVFFLTCVEQVEQPADYQSPQPASKPTNAGARKDQNGKGNGQKRKGDRRDGDRSKRDNRPQNEGPRVWSFGAPSETPPADPVADKMFVPDYIFAPGGDALEQANAWLAPVTSINLANLKFAHAQKAGAADEDARGIAASMRLNVDLIGNTRSDIATLAAELKGMSQNTRDAATETVTAKKRFDAATEVKRQLQLDTLSYGRLKQSYKKGGKAEDAEANAHLAVIKDDLDQRRTTVNAEFEAAKNASSDAEMARHFAYSPEEVDRAMEVMSGIERSESELALHMTDLKATVKRYEDRIDAVRKAA